MSRAFNLYQKYSIAELQEIEARLKVDPKNKNPNKNSPWIYNNATNKKLNDIAWAITYHLKDKREAEGRPVNQDGYTGRNNKR